MITLTHYSGKAVGVFGLGKAGEATVAALLAGGADVYAWDDSEASRNALHKKFRKARLLPIAQWPWKRMSCLVLSPGVPLTHPAPHPVARLAQANNCPVIGDIELLYTACPEATYVGITGTNGKSTTTSLIAHILKVAGRRVEVGGNLGTAALSLAPLGKDEIYVLETSSYQLDLLKTVRFNVSVLLNITPDHLDRHGDMQGYIAAKMHIFDRQRADDVAVIATEDEYTRLIAEELCRRGSPRVNIVSSEGAAAHRLADIPTLTGRHNWQNAEAAYAAAKALGVQGAVIERAMHSFPGLSHRLELVAEERGVRFINDSKATNADATANALAPYSNIYWIAGGKPKSGGIGELAPFFGHIAHAFLIGQASPEFAATLEGKVRYTRCGTLDVAVAKAAQMAFAEKKEGAVVLLSPACASFDQFKNFEERGDAFKTLVQGVMSAHAA